MIKRTIEISRQPVYLCLKRDQLVVQPRGPEPAEAATIPCEDIGFLVIDQPGATVSLGALRGLLRHGGALVVCGEDHLPAGLLLPVSGHTEVVIRLNDQIAVKRSTKKRLWSQLVVAKIRAQAANLAPDSIGRRRLLSLARQVRSGDPANVEAQAAKVYWREWLAPRSGASRPRFRRDPDGPPPNNLLNYGYAVLRAALARALVGAGLHPALGLHHSNRSNPFCLADDLLEPLRPVVDARARVLFLEGRHHLEQPVKAALLELLTAPVRVEDHLGPLMVALPRVVASLYQAYIGRRAHLSIPIAAQGPQA